MLLLTRFHSGPVIHHRTPNPPRAFGVEPQWMDRNVLYLDDNMRAGFHNQAVNRWLSLRMEMLGAGLCLSAGLVAVALRGTMSPSVLVR